MDRRARDYSRHGQRLLASDLVFSDGIEKMDAAVAAVERARLAEAETTLAAINSGRRDGADGCWRARRRLGMLLMFVLVPLPRAPVAVPVAVPAASPESRRGGRLQPRLPPGKRAAVRAPGRRGSSPAAGSAGAECRRETRAARRIDLLGSRCLVHRTVARNRHAGLAAGARARRQAPRRLRAGDLDRRPGWARARCR